MNKLTPAKRLKQLKANGWLEFVEFMEAAKISPKNLCYTPDFLKEFSRNKSFLWLAQDVEKDMFSSPEHIFDAKPYQMMGLSKQVAPKPTKKNKMVRNAKRG